MANAFIQKIVQMVASHHPGLKKQLRIAHIRVSPQEFVYGSFKFALPFSLGLTVLFFFIVDKAGLPLGLLPMIFIMLFFTVFNFQFMKVKARIVKRQKEIDREVIFAGQYLLIKLYSGKPILNALVDTSKSYGVASKYIGEIIADIDTGNSLEKALDNAVTYSPSEKFRRILFHLNNALRLGIDVTEPLSNVLEEITKEQELEIKKYGKKLNTVIIFYMLAAIVMPSIGMTLFIVISSFINFKLGLASFIVVLMFLALMQLMFISIFRSIRPTVNL